MGGAGGSELFYGTSQGRPAGRNGHGRGGKGGKVGKAQKPRGWESEAAVLTSPGSRAARQ